MRKTFFKNWGPVQDRNYGRTAYAQEGEDVLLWRMMDSDHSSAIFVDVGCNHPFRMSNTAFFYERGWTGIAIDPNPDFEIAFNELRPKDKFVNCGVGATKSSLEYFRFEESLFNTFDSEKANYIANHHSKLIEKKPVAVRRLDSILSEFWPNGQSIRFLTIDCEGMDNEVVQSHDFDLYPVDFVCVELDSLSCTTVSSEAAVLSLNDAGFVLISKLCKSAILIHQSVTEKWGLTFR